MKRRLGPPLIGVVYIIAIGVLGGLRPDHVLIGLLGLLDLYNERTRRFLREFFPFILTGVIYDSMRYYYWQGIAGHVHVEGPYLFEKRWFGVGGQTPNEWFAIHHWAVADLASGFAYLTFVGEFLALTFYFFFRERFAQVRTLAWSFLILNLMGFVTYFIFPVAPPWYVSQYGLGPARMDVRPTAASASRFDSILGTHLFEHMYDRGVDVYGAYPSLHVAYPLVVALVVFSQPDTRWARAPAAAFFLLMCFSAVYLQHHYVTDALLGISYALATLWLVRRGLRAQFKAARASALQPAASGAPLAASASSSARE